MKNIGTIHSPESLYDIALSASYSEMFLLALRDIELHLKEINTIGFDEVQKLRKLVKPIFKIKDNISNYFRKIELCEVASSIYAMVASKGEDKDFVRDASTYSEWWKEDIDTYSRILIARIIV